MRAVLVERGWDFRIPPPSPPVMPATASTAYLPGLSSARLVACECVPSKKSSVTSLLFLRLIRMNSSTEPRFFVSRVKVKKPFLCSVNWIVTSASTEPWPSQVEPDVEWVTLTAPPTPRLNEARSRCLFFRVRALAA